MCGIFGLIGEVDLSALRLMGDRLRHRGPDDEGYVLFGDQVVPARGAETVAELAGLPLLAENSSSGPWRMAFGHRRLSIIDTGPTGHQPMASADGRYWIVYNGELYNYRELRRELEGLGRSFRTQSDTEVVLAAFAEWQTDAFRRFNGMFAFAIHDTRSGEVYLVRDRFGIKPLYHYLDDRGIVFASEIGAIRKIRKLSVDERALFHFLAGKCIPEAPATFYRDVTLLEPGHFLRCRGGEIETQRWQELPRYPAHLTDLADSFEKETAAFRRLFDASVHDHLVADVPVAFCLSGGLDSSAIVGAVARGGRFRDAMHTFSAVFPGEECDERRWMEAAVEGTETIPHFTTPSPGDFLGAFALMTAHLDEPVMDSTLYVEWCVMKRVREAGIKVVLNGHGADELLAGYGGGLKRFLAQVRLEHGEEACRQQERLFRERTAYDFLQPTPAAGKPAPSPFRMIRDDLHREYSGTGRPAVLSEGRFNEDLLDQFFRRSLPRQLVWADRHSMAFSVECRVPFIEPALVERVFSLPGNFKLHDGWTKWPLRCGLDGILDERVRWRTSKFGYTAPDRRWFPDLQDTLLETILDGRRFSGRYLDIDRIERSAAGIRTAEDQQKLFRAAAVTHFLAL